jgi:phage gpG-like protein
VPTLLKLEFWGEAQVSRTIRRVGENVEDLRPAYDAIADLVVAENRRNFDTEGGHASGGWAPLSPKYAAWKARHYPGKPILELTGDLRDDLTERPMGVEVIEPQTIRLGSTLRYGGYHQAGSGILPRRRPVEFTEAARRDMTKILQRFIITGKVSP